jgi:hypothetical protein
MDLRPILMWIENGALATWIRESDFVFPTIETAHVLSIVTDVGSITKLDRRLLGLASRERPISAVLSDVLPWTWWAFLSAAITGGLLFSSKALEYYEDGPFRAKMVLLLFAGLNMAIFELFTKRGISEWDKGRTPWRVKLAGGLSLALWVTIVACGRWIGFTTS